MNKSLMDPYLTTHTYYFKHPLRVETSIGKDGLIRDVEICKWFADGDPVNVRLHLNMEQARGIQKLLNNIITPYPVPEESTEQ
jgi:ABC-type ATPase with predicted acetyltransferase domain